ncbi:T3SS effector HopA1 family protein [Staphylococcus agnetis]|uniref:T3SS effector HopA1 family protein n=1 Tax=Staphylococcus agnetis TaxID=985762 RepID=UPI001431DB93|nr:T3SS effector HopA1 family protein [Staphylococcus agnetis]NJH97158.1 hypothetical protein [Staphylococcus agnetis]
MTKKNDIDNLISIINLKVDLNQVQIFDQTYTGVLENPKNKLIQWLYSVLHTGNTDTQKSESLKSLNDLDSKIISKIKDPQINISCHHQSIENTIYPVVDGIRINEQIDETESKIKLPCFRPNLTPGFFMYINSESNMKSTKIYRHYIYCENPDYAIDLWAKCVGKLTDRNIEFSAKVLSASKNYPRNDALVFYSGKDKEHIENVLINEVKKEPIKLVKESMFSKKLYENLFVAEEPVHSNGLKQSFGEHRSSAIADAIQDYFITGVDFKLLLKQRLLSYNININDLSKNI